MEQKPILLNSKNKREMVDRIVSECREKANQIVANWELVDSSWPVVDGCAYLRLSTDEQVAVEKGSLEQQINIAVSEATIRSHADRRNYRISKFFIEPGITGTTDRRPELQTLLSEIRSQRHKFIILKELARITRETNVWKDFFKLCIGSDCQIMIRNFPFNPNDPAQIFQLDILAAFAEYESNQTSRRVRESVYSAMINSGKFNSTHRVLGLKQLVVNDQPQVGFYVPDNGELKTVTWIMETFVKYASYAKTLEECDRMGILNWNQSPFKTHALVNLLTNKRYIGRWELNVENKDKDQQRLMPYDRYAEVELPHGCLIDITLWQKVQKTIQMMRGRKDKNLNINRVYPLSGLLVFKDGSRFAGSGAWKEEHRHNYYYNKTNDIRLVAETVESEARRIASQIIRETKELEEAIAKYGKDRMTASKLVLEQIYKMRTELADMEKEKVALNRRLDFILDGASQDEIQNFKKEYKQNAEKLNQAIAAKSEQIAENLKKADLLSRDEFDWKGLGKNGEAVLAAIQDKDPVALKNAYRHLFEVIVVGDLDKDGKTELKFILRGEGSGDFPPPVNGRKDFSFEIKMAQKEGLEPPTQRLTAACSTN
jgi:DNA invertase Pin-like site-specific DNA recombinase